MAMAASTDLNTPDLTGTPAFALLPLANFTYIFPQTKERSARGMREWATIYEVLGTTYKWDSPVLHLRVHCARGRLLYRNQVGTRI